jgi:hypothetical protein
MFAAVSACSPSVSRARPFTFVIAALISAVALAACGGGSRQDVAEPTGNYTVAVTHAFFPASQKLAQHTHMLLTIKNLSAKPMPNVAVTVCNGTCAYPAPPGQGSSTAPFATQLNEKYLADSSRPLWIVDRPPGRCIGRAGYSCQSGGPGGYASAYNNTWASGRRLAPGASVTFIWGLTAVSPGIHVVAWAVAAGLNGKAKATLSGGGSPQGRFIVRISPRPSQSYVNNAGQIVTTPTGR